MSISFIALGSRSLARRRFLAASTLALLPAAALAQPANDRCESAQLITAHNGPYFGDADLADTDGSIACNGLTSTQKDVWFKFIPAISGLYRLATCGSGYDTNLAIFSACPDAAPAQLACNDDNGPACVGTASSIDFNFTAGNEYLIRLAAWGSFTRPYSFNLTPRFTTGACCVNVAGASTCQIRPAPECASLGGQYQGDDAACATVASASASEYASAPMLPIPDLGAVSDSIIVDNFVGTIGELSVHVEIMHPFVGDLFMELVHQPSGVRSLIWQRTCDVVGRLASAGIDAEIADGGSASVTCPTALEPIIVGTRQPADPFANFLGRPANGTWTLRVSDDAFDDAGTLVSWRLAVAARESDACGSGGGGGNCPGDFDQSRSVEVGDIFAFLTAWFSEFGSCTGACVTDADGSGAVAVMDIFAFLGLWFGQFGTPCL